MANRGNSPAAGIFGAGLLGIALAIFMPIIYGVMGFVIGAIGGLLYNLFAAWLGGVELELEPRPAGLTAPYPLIPPATPIVNI
jgi:hypothetical protein